MDGHRFDELTRGLAHGRSRRSVMKGLGAAVLGAAGMARFGAAEAKTTCRDAGHPCEGNQTCCDGLVCLANGPGAAKRCTACSSGTVIHDGACCTPNDHDVTCADTCGPATDNCGQTVDCGACCAPAAATCATGNECCSGVCTCGGNDEAGRCQGRYVQDFSNNAYDWSGVMASSGVGVVDVGSDFPAYSRWGGYSSIFPSGGYATSVNIYLDTTAAYANDTRFDWDSAISNANCGFGRDFVFNVGFYNDTDVTGSGPRFVISASNNAGRDSSYPKNPGRSPIAITDPGWYTFTHTFYDAGGGQLAVDLAVAGHTWTLSDSTDIIGTTIGGNRYGAFPNQEFAGLQIDDASRG